MTHDEMPDGREEVSRMEAIAYIESLLPEFVTLAASQPRLQALLREAHIEAERVVTGFKATPMWRETSSPG